MALKVPLNVGGVVDFYRWYEVRNVKVPSESFFPSFPFCLFLQEERQSSCSIGKGVLVQKEKIK